MVYANYYEIKVNTPSITGQPIDKSFHDGLEQIELTPLNNDNLPDHIQLDIETIEYNKTKAIHLFFHNSDRLNAYIINTDQNLSGMDNVIELKAIDMEGPAYLVLK